MDLLWHVANGDSSAVWDARVRYLIEFTPETRKHLEALTARQRATVLDAAERQLTHQPTSETRHRKPMRPNRLAGWELRVGGLRACHDVVEVPRRTVVIRAVGVKDRERVRIGGQQGDHEVFQDDEDAGRG